LDDRRGDVPLMRLETFERGCLSRPAFEVLS
jgi:hypothetical protein